MSWQMRAVAAYARLLRKPRSYGSARSAERFLHRPKGSPEPPARLAKSRQLRITRETCPGGFTSYLVSPGGGHTERGSIIYVHGGGYVSEILAEHWSLIADIVDATQRSVHVPIYGLAPNHTAIEAVRFIQQVLAVAHPPCYLLGDSAGGGLALAATQVWLSEGGTPPVGLTLISPWLDIAISNPDAAEVAARDPWLGIEGARHVGRRWARGLALNDPRVSPIFGRLDNLPPMEIYVGHRDILMPDCRRLSELVGPARSTCHLQAGALHVYPLLPVPEGRHARRRLISRIAYVMSEAC